MIVDSSALVAITAKEDDAEIFVEAIKRPTRPAISSVNAVETLIVLSRRKAEGWAADRFTLEWLEASFDLRIIPPDREITLAAIAAHHRFGRGRHPAKLNFGDCFAYATAKVLDQPLLFKGDDFRQTDIVPALAG